MQKIEDIKTKLEKLKPVLKERYQVETVGFFGSYARGEQKKKSDVDVLVEFSQPNTIDLLDFIELEEFLSKQLDVKVARRSKVGISANQMERNGRNAR
jgi:predicted nucleotidyltransferase